MEETTNAPPALCVIGWSGSGKTTLISRLLPELKARGLRVSAVKHSSDPHPLHKPGSDTAAFERAGAAPVALATPQGVALLHPGRSDIVLPALISSLAAAADVVLIEGWKDGPYPKLEVWRKDVGPALYRGGTAIEALITDDAPEALPPEVKRFTTGEVQGLALFVARWVSIRGPWRP